VPTFNEIWVIDHSTSTAEAAGHTGGFSGKGGDLIYRFGNAQAYKGDGPSTLFYPHDAHWVDLALNSTHPEYGKIAVFNNKAGIDYSTAHTFSPIFDTYLWEYQNLPNGDWAPNTFDWTYSPNPPQSFYSTGLGAIQILPNGNRLINEGREGRAFEINDNDEIVWEYINPLKMGNPVPQYDTTITPVTNQQFRFTRYPADYSAFEGKSLDPIGYIELEPDTLFCTSVTGTVEIEENLNYVSMFPNPANDIVNFVFDQNKIPNDLVIKDGLGKTVYTTQVIQSNIQVDLSNLCAGFYYISIDNTTNLRLLKN
jgi:hypothetical protein